ncbi:MAG TPA: hypothetical protein P5509_04980 [Bacteroidales bacterium]|mgnify:CR=1 FL=1|nr:hypothetical protein [Bacteroidales bacterium]
MTGLYVTVYKDADGSDCSANGITSCYSRLILVGEGVDGPFEVKKGEPYLKFVKRNMGRGEYLHAEPVNFGSGEIGPMFGGNFIYTSDSRFPSDYPIPVHDRFES